MHPILIRVKSPVRVTYVNARARRFELKPNVQRLELDEADTRYAFQTQHEEPTHLDENFAANWQGGSEGSRALAPRTIEGHACLRDDPFDDSCGRFDSVDQIDALACPQNRRIVLIRTRRRRIALPLR